RPPQGHVCAGMSVATNWPCVLFCVCRKEHWKLLGNLKTTVEGLVSSNNPNVWSKYGGLERLCRDMHGILYHGLIHDKVYCRQKAYWQFVKDIRWLSPHAAHHVEKFIHLHENGQLKADGVSDQAIAERWLHHSLQFHCLSAQLKPLLENRQYIRKFYTDAAFLLSDAHVTAMLQCLEAVEQNNPRLLAQIDTSTFLRRSEAPLPVTKSQSLTALPGSVCIPPVDYAQHRYFRSFSDLSSMSQPLEKGLSNGSPLLPEDGSPPDQPGLPQLCVPSHRDSSSVSEMSLSTVTSQSQDAWAGGQDDPQGDANDGPEYLAIGNLGRRARACSTQSSASSSSADGSESSSKLFSSSSSQKPESVSSLEDQGASGGGGRAMGLLRRSSFSEGQTSAPEGILKRSHARSHSDTNVASGKTAGGLRSISIILEDPVAEAGQYLSSGEGMFRRPSEGQSLISYLSEQDFGSCADLEKENAHFSISESLIAAIELMKCNLMSRRLEEEEEESDKEIQELKQKIRIRRQQIRTKHLLPAYQGLDADSFAATDSGSQFSSRDSMWLSDSGSAEDVEDADCPVSLCRSHSFLHSNSAEAVAMGLLKQFEGMQLPAASELDWLVPEHDAPQKLLPIPDSLPISPDDGEHADIYKLRIRVRGNLEWAPPRPQIIFNIHPAPTRKVAVAKQNYRCAGCGIRTDPDYIRRLRYCEYLGKYFCQCCHENAQMVIPGRILRKWDFGKYYVSNFSRDLLSKIWSDPLFSVQDLNAALYRKVKALNQVRLLRIQLFHLKNMFKTCRLAKELLDSFDVVPGHLTEDLHLYSLNDLNATKKGELVPRLMELIKAGTLHVERCMLCQAKGFICEFCQNEEDVIFPFELNKCSTCGECNACYHKTCFRSGCPRCERLHARREMLAKQDMESCISDYEEEEEPPREAAAAT
uniref:Rubicon autophagy regulator n=1 Tax=Pelusios castaneus TaxID=367368 RepID=A0A8C8RWE8_9SAUR